MRFVSPFLKKILYPSLSAAGVFRRASAPGLAVVTYHGVVPHGYEPVDAALDGNLVTAESLRQQVRLLKSDYRIISPEDALAWRQGKFELPLRAALLTCDDGLLNNLTEMLPVLNQEEVPCLFFVTGASAGESRTTLWYEDLLLLFLRARAGVFAISHAGVEIRGELRSREQRVAIWWDTVKKLSKISAETRRVFMQSAGRELGVTPTISNLTNSAAERDSAACRRFGLMTLPELRTLAAAGMTIGAHTMSHPMLSQMAPELARAEIVECRTKLAAALEKDVWAFAYPFGDSASVTPHVLAMPKEAGYDGAFLNFGGGMGVALPPYALPRLHVTAEMSLPEFEAHVSGFHSRLQQSVGRSEPAFEANPI
jgi:peptidoglycan/xylan/chitin deacetylase (PgdA/CDA1 family)